MCILFLNVMKVLNVCIFIWTELRSFVSHIEIAEFALRKFLIIYIYIYNYIYICIYISYSRF